MRKINTVCGDLKNIVKEYASRTTVHGIRYINEDKFSAIERIWWAIVFILSVATCSVFIYHILEKWSRSPVIVTFASQPTAITEVNLNENILLLLICSFPYLRNVLLRFS